MRKYKNQFVKFSIAVIIIFSSSLFSQDMKNEIIESLKETFGNDCNIEMNKYIIDKKLKAKIENDAQQKFFQDFVYLYIIKTKNNMSGYAILDNVYGKSLPITFLVTFDLKLNIKSVYIIKYREQYGGAVKNKSWNNQFIGKNSESSFKVGEDINSISGATISVKSVTKGIQKLSLLIKEIVRSEH